MGTDPEMLLVGDCVLKKAEQDPMLKLDDARVFAPD